MLNPQFMQIVAALSTTDISKAPNYIVAKALALHPATKYPNPVEVAFAVKAEVNQDFVEDEDFGKVMDAYVQTLNNLYAQIQKDFPTQAPDCFCCDDENNDVAIHVLTFGVHVSLLLSRGYLL